MRKLALIGLCIAMFAVWALAQNRSGQASSSSSVPTATTPAQPSAVVKPSQKPPASAPKEGTLTVQAQFLGFFSRGEGTLTLRGKGYLIVADVQGEYTVSGFTLQKSLPRGVQIPAPWNERVKIYFGNGTLTLKGKYDAVRGNLKNASLQFRGNGAFNVSGIGKAQYGDKEINLYPTAATTLLVPEPQWQNEEPDVVPNPKLKR